MGYFEEILAVHPSLWIFVRGARGNYQVLGTLQFARSADAEDEGEGGGRNTGKLTLTHTPPHTHTSHNQAL